jgi:hypothetical protein
MSDRATQVAETLRYAEQLALAARQRKQTAETWFGNWLVRSYFGPSPESTKDLSKISHSACAVTMDVRSGDPPNLRGIEGAIRVDFDDRSVIWMSAETSVLLTRKLNQIFPGFSWTPVSE